MSELRDRGRDRLSAEFRQKSATMLATKWRAVVSAREVSAYGPPRSSVRLGAGIVGEISSESERSGYWVPGGFNEQPMILGEFPMCSEGACDQLPTSLLAGSEPASPPASVQHLNQVLGSFCRNLSRRPEAASNGRPKVCSRIAERKSNAS